MEMERRARDHIVSDDCHGIVEPAQQIVHVPVSGLERPGPVSSEYDRSGSERRFAWRADHRAVAVQVHADAQVPGDRRIQHAQLINLRPGRPVELEDERRAIHLRHRAHDPRSDQRAIAIQRHRSAEPTGGTRTSRGQRLRRRKRMPPTEGRRSAHERPVAR